MEIEKTGQSKFQLVPNPLGSGYQLFLNGVDISAGVTDLEFTFQLKGGRKPKIRLIILGDIEIPEQLLADIIVGKEGEQK